MAKRPLKDLSFAAFLSFLLLTIFFLRKAQTAFSATNHPVISEVQIAGAGGVNEDFIEIYNPTDTPYDLNGHRLVKRSASGTSDSPIKAWDSETIIPAHGYYLWANSSWTPSVSPDTATSATLAANNGIALRHGPEDTGTIIDSVAWGSATNAFVENAPFPTNPDAGKSIERVGDDTDNNSVDFVLQNNPNPQNLNFSPSPTPTTQITPTPTEEPTPTPTEEITPTPTSESTVTPTETPIPTTTPTTQITPSPSPIPTPEGGVIGHFWLP